MTAFVIVRVTSHGSVSPKAHSRVAPERSPAAPDWRTSRCPCRPDIRLATSRSSALPSWRIAFGRELQLTVRALLQVAGVAQRLLELLEGPGIDRGLLAELAGQLVEVEVVHPGAAVRLGELLGQGVEVGQVLEYAGPVAQAEPLLALEPLGAAPVLTGPEGLQVVVELGERLHQLRRAECLRGQGVELVALLLGHRVAHPLGSGGALGQRVEQLVDGAGVLREEVAVLGHELVELLGGVLTAAVRSEQVVEVAEHLVDLGPVLVRGVLEGLLHPLRSAARASRDRAGP